MSMKVFKIEFNDYNSTKQITFYVEGNNIGEVTASAIAFRGSRKETGITVSQVELTNLAEHEDKLKKLMK